MFSFAKEIKLFQKVLGGPSKKITRQAGVVRKQILCESLLGKNLRPICTAIPILSGRLQFCQNNVMNKLRLRTK